MNIDKIVKDLEGAVMPLNDSKQARIDSISTGLVPFDVVTTIGGFPSGRIVEVYGLQSSGKSSLCFSAMRQNPDKVTVYFDAEGGLDIEFLKAMGINTDNVLVSHDSCGESIFGSIEKVIGYDEVGLIVVDSVAAIVPREEIEDPIKARGFPIKAKMMSVGLPRIVNKLNGNTPTVVFINQTRENIDGYGPSTTTPGGKALGFYAALRVELKRSGVITEGEHEIGVDVDVFVRKNKCGPAARKCSISFLHGKGFDPVFTEVDFAIKNGIIEKAGSWLKFDGVSEQGRLRMFKHVREVIDTRESLQGAIRAYIRG